MRAPRLFRALLRTTSAPIPYESVANMSKAEWKRRLTALPAAPSAAERTFSFEATEAQLHAVDAAWKGGGGTVQLIVGADGSLGCTETRVCRSVAGRG